MKHSKTELQIKTVEVTYKVKYIDMEGLVLPEKGKVKVAVDWLPIRHGVLLNEYMKWCQNHRGSKQEFAKQLEQEIKVGLHPVLSKTVLDDKQEPFTYYSIMSQLDWIAQPENLAIVTEPDSTEKKFYPNNLMFLTSKQKSEEARRARTDRSATADVAYNLLSKLSDKDKKALIDALASTIKE